MRCRWGNGDWMGSCSSPSLSYHCSYLTIDDPLALSTLSLSPSRWVVVALFWLTISPPSLLPMEEEARAKRNGLGRRREPRGASGSRRMGNGRCRRCDRCLALGSMWPLSRCQRGAAASGGPSGAPHVTRFLPLGSHRVGPASHGRTGSRGSYATDGRGRRTVAPRRTRTRAVCVPLNAVAHADKMCVWLRYSTGSKCWHFGSLYGRNTCPRWTLQCSDFLFWNVVQKPKLTLVNPCLVLEFFVRRSWTSLYLHQTPSNLYKTLILNPLDEGSVEDWEKYTKKVDISRENWD
jgi:hypothetical protein